MIDFWKYEVNFKEIIKDNNLEMWVVVRIRMSTNFLITNLEICIYMEFRDVT